MNNIINDYTRSVQTYCADLKKIKTLPQETIKQLLPKAKQKDINATNKILESNLKYVFKVAKTLRGRGVPLLDLISEGNLGILKAIDKFDLKKNYSFLTYANSWIKAFMLLKIKEEQKKKELISINEFNDNFRKNIKKNEDEDNLSINDIPIQDENIEFDDESKKFIDNLLNKLTKIEAQVIRMSFGFEYGKSMTMDEISEVIGGSSERARQIKEKALKKLRCYALKDDSFFEIFNKK